MKWQKCRSINRPMTRKNRNQTKIKGVCVYCGSGKGLNSSYAIAARKLGKALGDNGIRLIYGGGSLGLMGEIARATLGAGGKVTGIIPEFLGHPRNHVEGCRRIDRRREYAHEEAADVRPRRRLRRATRWRRHA